jgi:hypothetical protein
VRPGTQDRHEFRDRAAGRVDLSIAKSFELGRTVRLQVQAESFNAFNCRQYNNPMTNITRVRGYAMGAPRATRRPATEPAPAPMIALMRLPAQHQGSKERFS